METVTSTVDPAEIFTSIVSPVVLVAGLVVAALIMCGFAARIALWFEELPHQAALRSQRKAAQGYGPAMELRTRVER